MRSIRVLYYHQYFNTPSMGGSTRSYEIARRLSKMGVDVTIVTALRNSTSSKKVIVEELDGFKVYWLNIPYSNKMGFARRVYSFLQYALRATVIGNKIEADIVYASSTPLTVALPALVCSKRKKIPMIFEVRDLWPQIPIAMGVIKNPLVKWVTSYLELITYKNASKIIALSPDMKSHIVSLGLPNEKVIVVPNAADIDFFQNVSLQDKSFREELNISKDAIVVLYAGTFGNVNGCEYIIKLASKLIDNNSISFVLIGEGKEKEFLVEMSVNKKVLNHNVYILPQVSKSNIPSFFKHSDLIISTIVKIPALEANSANKVFDGLAAGRGILINHGGWISEFLTTENAGVQLSWDIGEAAIQLADLASDKKLILTMGKNAKQLAEAKFNRDHLTDQIAEVITAVYNS